MNRLDTNLYYIVVLYKRVTNYLLLIISAAYSELEIVIDKNTKEGMNNYTFPLVSNETRLEEYFHIRYVFYYTPTTFNSYE